MRHGSTLLEVVLALAVLGMALAVTLESMVGISSFARFQERQGDLAEQCRRLADHLHRDLANTAWFVRTGKDGKQQERLYPQVIAGDSKGFGDALYFLRLRSEHRLAPTPGGTTIATVDFSREPPVPMDRYARAEGVRSLLLNPQWRGDRVGTPFAIPAWESPAPLTFSGAQDPAKLRHYRLIVRPDLAVTGRGVLLREYRDGLKGPWRDDERLAENIVRFTVRTNREQPGLHPNQLLVSVVMQVDDPQTGEPRQRRTLDMAVAMRSGFSE
jgi:type II secretory pathway pseudopilin PulG